MDRRGFLGAILLTATAPAIVRVSSLMQIKAPKIWLSEASLEDAVIELAAYKYRWFPRSHMAAALKAGWEVVKHEQTPYLAGGLRLLQLPITTKDFYRDKNGN